VLDELNATIRKAQTKFEFANIWEHRKIQKILIAGFKNLGEAINNMKNEVVSSIENLENSIKSDFRHLKNDLNKGIENFEASQATLNSTLSSMDNKLYFIQYKKKPFKPFV